MPTTTIKVTRHGSTKQVRATVSESGLLGVHRIFTGMWETVDKWQISHVPTGYVVFGFCLKRDALRIMRYIDGWDWDFASVEAVPKSTRKRSLDLLSILRNDALLEELSC